MTEVLHLTEMEVHGGGWVDGRCTVGTESRLWRENHFGQGERNTEVYFKVINTVSEVTIVFFIMLFSFFFLYVFAETVWPAAGNYKSLHRCKSSLTV